MTLHHDRPDIDGWVKRMEQRIQEAYGWNNLSLTDTDNISLERMTQMTEFGLNMEDAQVVETVFLTLAYIHKHFSDVAEHLEHAHDAPPVVNEEEVLKIALGDITACLFSRALLKGVITQEHAA